MSLKRKLAAVLAGVGIAPFIVVVSAGTANAHGYITSPPSRQANCAAGKVSNCGDIIYEPPSVEGPKGQQNCHGGDARWAPLNDDRKAWPAASVGDNVTFNWLITANHSTSTWQYWVGGSKIAEFNDHGRQPGRTVQHAVSLGGRTGRIKLLAIWNIADTAMAFYNCVDLQVGPGGPGPTTTPTTTTTTTTQPTTTTTTTPPVTGPWAAGVTYPAGSQVTYGGSSFRCIQGHTSLTGWEPPNVASLWQRL
ncbi:lytic polysaccharide monooxygenase [Actinosynnema sp. NPDC047251]|uniref:Chitin-binding domain 3 protein n=1 Tax=Saccharothrix espanaensis (strain ATCC 51144 / DSM 44229 / JCM 9112 / NBRC 15066 / NRRL 15764) TaxID=1179773 RepID=K0K1S9_SACES|nr:lytic polysaccharide monooxygenase [Saccharothrix espanaensis]CCH30819.1 Chitin-binding domain 3 protein [Saccharothrix espanaensis DSM 44229]